MWILTQSGNRILTTDGLEEIFVSAPIEGKTDYAVMLRRRTDGKPFALGFYYRRDRALEIIKEIIKVQAEYLSSEVGPDLITGSYQPSYVSVPPKVYTMPADKNDDVIPGQLHISDFPNVMSGTPKAFA